MNNQIKTKCRVRIFYPADPLGTIPGGIDTFIRGILKWSPEDIDVSLVGVSTDADCRPAGRWSVCDLGRRTFRFFPVTVLNNPGKRQGIPLSVRFTFGLLRHWAKVSQDYDVAEFHRIEPSILFLGDRRPKNAFFHQDMAVLRNTKADILWRHLPRLYFFLEDQLIPRLTSVFCVKDDAVRSYQARFPTLAERFRFSPTWMDPDIFYPAADTERKSLRRTFSAALGLNNESQWLVTVGRLDQQKDPHLLLDGLIGAKAVYPGLQLVFIGDGVLRDELVQRVSAQGLEDSVKFAGLRPAPEVARLLQAADLFVLSSAYEGMPMCVLEALGTGLPVVSTDVGEVGLVVKPGINGTVIADRTPSEMANGMVECLARLESLSGKPCINSVVDYVPERVLSPVYEAYRTMASGIANGPVSNGQVNLEENLYERTRRKVLSAPIDALGWETALSRILAWSIKRESRYVCICNVHSVVTASQNDDFLRVVSTADMATPDGMPVAWMLRFMGSPGQERINGPDLMWKYCALAERQKEAIYLYGSTQQTLDLLEIRLKATFPELRIAGMHSPPFRPPRAEEDAEIVDRINNSGAGVVFVSLGCPKQELWMSAHRDRVHAVMVGVGAAFDYHAGTVKRAPVWMQQLGMEWLHRLYSEPRRLWKRYLVTNTLFVLGAGAQLIKRSWRA